MHTYIREFEDKVDQQVTVKGWVANMRTSKKHLFIILRDGSGFAQCVVSEDEVGEELFEQAKSLTQESALSMTGTVVEDERQIGGYELQVDDLDVYHIADEYPITPKPHGVKFLADRRHLWLRSSKPWAAMRVRNELIMAIHRFFQDRGFVQMDSPIFTGNAAEGTTTLFETDFFGQPAYLAQTGQLYAEAAAMAQGLVYTFGPTFRAEKSDTPRHLAEFWMIEPEMAFYDNEMNMDLIEEFTRYIVKRTLENCSRELDILERDVTTLEKVDQHFPRITYDDAVKILRGEQEVDGKNAIEIQEQNLEQAKRDIEDKKQDIEEREELIKSGIKKGKRKHHERVIKQLRQEITEHEEDIRNIPKWIESAEQFEYGEDFGNSDETVLTHVFDAPVMVYNWPADIKAFYMKEVEDNADLVKGVDLLAPDGFGEIVGGSERETDLDKLLRKIDEHGLDREDFEWYLDLRRYGSVPHSGFGLGLERIVRWICGLDHLRETIPFPRRYGRLFP